MNNEQYRQKIDELASLMAEFGLREGSIDGDGYSITFAREDEPNIVYHSPSENGAAISAPPPAAQKQAKPAAPKGTPISSPMMGIYYAAPSPGAPDFVKVGDVVNAGQVIGLIEAMKVFNEITSTVSGRVVKIAAKNGELVQPGDALVYIE